jgi:putative oxidoreductase
VFGKIGVWAEQIALNLLRVVAGFLFWQHGAQKLFGLFGGLYGEGQPVEFFSLMGLAGLLETAGGALLVFGLFTRPVAFVLAGEMAWAYFSVHAPEGIWPIMPVLAQEGMVAGGNRGELAALYAFVFLFMATRGGGAFSVDGIRQLRGKKKPGPAAEPTADAAPEDDFPELTEEDLAEDPEIAELLGDDPKS